MSLQEAFLQLLTLKNQLEEQLFEFNHAFQGFVNTIQKHTSYYE